MFVDAHLNNRVAGAAGIILDPKGQLETTYAWGLGNSTNNQAEAYALIQGLLSINVARTKTLIAMVTQV